MNLIETLLQPIRPDSPCGGSLAGGAELLALETAARGKTGTQFSEAVEPDWKDVRDRSVALLRQSKDLRVSLFLTMALLKLDGLPGFRDGLVLLQGLIERYWNSLYPQLDPEDNNDPTERVNILASLSTPIKTFQDPTRFLERLCQAPLCHSARNGQFGLTEIIKGRSGSAEGGEKQGPSVAQVRAAFADTDAGTLQAISEAVSESVVLVKAMDDFLTKTIGAEQAPDWGGLTSTLKEIQKCLTTYLPKGTVNTSDLVSQEAAPGEGGTSISGEIQSRQDVIRALDRICEYYSQAEPSSPVPFLLRRAQRLVSMDFMQIINDLSPDTVAQVRLTAEAKDEGTASPTS